MKTAKPFYGSHDYKFKVNAETTKKTWQISMPEAGFDQRSKTVGRILEYFNVFIANHSAGMPHNGHFYNENSSYNFREIMVKIRWVFLCFDSWQHFVSPVFSLYYYISPSINTTISWNSNISQYIWLYVSAYLILSHLQAYRIQNSDM